MDTESSIHFPTQKWFFKWKKIVNNIKGKNLLYQFKLFNIFVIFQYNLKLSLPNLVNSNCKISPSVAKYQKWKSYPATATP